MKPARGTRGVVFLAALAAFSTVSADALRDLRSSNAQPVLRRPQPALALPRLVVLSPKPQDPTGAQASGSFVVTARISLPKAALDAGWQCCQIGPWASQTIVTENQVIRTYPYEVDHQTPGEPRLYWAGDVEFTMDPRAHGRVPINFRAWPIRPGNHQVAMDDGVDIPFFVNLK